MKSAYLGVYFYFYKLRFLFFIFEEPDKSRDTSRVLPVEGG